MSIIAGYIVVKNGDVMDPVEECATYEGALEEAKGYAEEAVKEEDVNSSFTVYALIPVQTTEVKLMVSETWRTEWTEFKLLTWE